MFITFYLHSICKVKVCILFLEIIMELWYNIYQHIQKSGFLVINSWQRWFTTGY